MIPHDRPATAAVGAGGDHLEHAAEAALGDLAASAAGAADDWRVPGLAPLPLQVSQRSWRANWSGFLATGGDFLERELDLGFQIVAALRPAAGPRPPPAAAPPRPCAAEDIVEHREDVAGVHVREVVAGAADALVAELVVAFALGVVGENFVGLGAFLECGLGFVLFSGFLSGWYFIASRR